MKPEEARRAIAAIAWIRDSRREARTIVSDDDSCEIRDCTYQNGNIAFFDQTAGRLVKAEGLASSRCYADFGHYTQKLILSFSGSAGEAEDSLNGLVYRFEVVGSRVTLVDKSKGQEFVFEVR